MEKIQNFYKKRLANGLTVLFEKRNIPVVSTSATIKFGSEYETGKIKGISHFMEHLLFKGTKNRTQKQISKEIEKKGGILNAFTSEEITSYWNKLPVKHFNSGLEIASDLILNPLFDKVEFEKEKQVIIEEIKMYHDTPIYYVFDKIKGMLYKKPFGMSVAGKANIIKNLKREQVVDLFKKVYSTDNMILCVVGNSDFGDICNKAEKIFPLKKRNIKERIPIKTNKIEVEKRKGIDQAHFIFGFHSSTMQQESKYADEVAMTYLTGGMSSVLFQEIREKRGLAYAVRGNVDAAKNFGYSTIYTGTTKEKIKEIKNVIIKEIKNLKSIKKQDFEQTKEQLIGLKKITEEDSSNTMNMLVFEESAGDAEDYYKYEEKISSVKLEEIKKLAKLKEYSMFSLIPK